MKKGVLITGVAGLLGSQMAKWIINNKPEYNVIGIDNLFGGYREYIPDGVIFYHLDLSKDSIKSIFERHDIEYVYHFAAYAAVGASPFIRKFNYDNNIISTMEIINNCIEYNVKRLVYTSSMDVYGHGDMSETRFDENDIPAPIDPYGISKYACEMDIKVAGEQHGLDWCILRPHNVYGINQNIWDKYRNVLGIWMNKILNDQDMLIYGDGEQIRAFSYIDDNLPCFWNAAILPEASKEIINIGGIDTCSINDAANMLVEIAGSGTIKHVEPRFEVKYAVPSYQKSIDILKYEQKTDLKTGLRLMWEWAKKQPKREQYKWTYEINKGVYSYWK